MNILKCKEVQAKEFALVAVFSEILRGYGVKGL